MDAAMMLRHGSSHESETAYECGVSGTGFHSCPRSTHSGCLLSWHVTPRSSTVRLLLAVSHHMPTVPGNRGTVWHVPWWMIPPLCERDLHTMARSTCMPACGPTRSALTMMYPDPDTSGEQALRVAPYMASADAMDGHAICMVEHHAMA